MDYLICGYVDRRVWTSRQKLQFERRLLRIPMTKDFAKRIGTNALKAIVALQRKAKLSRGVYRDQLYLFISYAVAIAREFEADEAKRREILRHPFWDTRRKKPRESDDILLTTLVFVFRASDRPGYGRAWKYRKAVSGFWDDGMPFRDVAKSIKEGGGITKLIGAEATKAAAEPRGTKTGSKVSSASSATVKRSRTAVPAFETTDSVMRVIEKAKNAALFSFRGRKKESKGGILVKLTRAKLRNK